MRIISVLFVILFIPLCSGFALPQIAVLDTIMAPGLDASAALPITERIIEELVLSGKYTILDRLHVAQVLKEKEFQLSSGIVKNEEMRQAGEYLGAEFVAIASASQVGTTFSIALKIVDVQTGEIVAQTSAEQKGGVEILLDLARVVGRQIVVLAAYVKSADTAAGGEKFDAAVILELQGLIRNQAFQYELGRSEMLTLSKSLPQEDRLALYTDYKKSGAFGCMLLNIIPSVGSWVQGDIVGGTTELSLLAAVVAAGFLTRVQLQVSIPLAVLVADVAGFIFPYMHEGTWNRNLSQALYIPLAQGEGIGAPMTALVPPDGDEGWKVELTLLSIRY